ncbi:MAG TPA: hypothetical protein VGA62_00245 [Acidimicrobiia bacterium]
MDLSKLSMGDRVIGVSGILLLVFSFFPWLGFSVAGFSESRSAWTFTLCWIAVILGVLMVAYVFLVKVQGVSLPDLGGVSWAQVMLIVAAVAFVFILIKVIAGPGTGGVSLSGTGVSKERKIGIFLGLIASAGLVGGAYLNAKEADELPSWLGGSKGGTA